MSYPELLQERYVDDPWKLLVCCILLNQTTRRQVDEVLEERELFKKWPDCSSMAAADIKQLEMLIQPCGLWHRRARTLITFSEQWENWLYEKRRRPEHADIRHFYGIGPYAIDSYRFFVDGDISRGPMSGDKELIAYYRRRHGEGKEEQAHPQDRGSDGDARGEAREGSVPGSLDA